MASSRLQVKMTLRSAARPRRALTGHSAGIFVSLHSLRFHLWFTPSTLPIHLVISYSHTFHLSVTWSARCPVTASQRTGQGGELSQNTQKPLDFQKCSPNALPLEVSHISLQCHSLPLMISSQLPLGHSACQLLYVWTVAERSRPTHWPLSVIQLLFYLCMVQQI